MDDLIERLRRVVHTECETGRPCTICETQIEGADRIERLEAERSHSLGCEHNTEHGNRCTFGQCYRQWQADRIAELEAALRLAIGLNRGLRGVSEPVTDEHIDEWIAAALEDTE